MDIDNLAEVVAMLKDTPRKGWHLRQVSEPESVADHSFGVALLVLMLCPPELDKQKCLEFALVHDLAEALTGDYVPEDDLPPQRKYEMETAAIAKIAEQAACPQLKELFSAYERRDTPEALFVKKMDKLEAVLQARYYDLHQRSSYFDRPRQWNSLFAEFADNAAAVLGKNLASEAKKIK